MKFTFKSYVLFRILIENVTQQIFGCFKKYFYHAEHSLWVFAHSPVEQQTLDEPQEVLSGHVFFAFDVFVHILAPPPPPLLTWHFPHTPMLTMLFLLSEVLALLVFPQNGFFSFSPIAFFVEHDVSVHYVNR